MTDDQIEHMVTRFLCWPIPKSFKPDGGIEFSPEFNIEYNKSQGLPPSQHEPYGTNLLTAGEAREMIKFILKGLPK